MGSRGLHCRLRFFVLGKILVQTWVRFRALGHMEKKRLFTIQPSAMKNVLLAYFALMCAVAVQAQPTKIKSNVPVGADPAAIDIEFLPVDALALPNGDIQMGVAPKGIVRNIGSLPYLTGGNGLNIVLYQLKSGKYEVVETTQVISLNAGATVEIQYYTTYIKGKQKPPKFRLEVRSVDKNVPNPDVNMKNNTREEVF